VFPPRYFPTGYFTGRYFPPGATSFSFTALAIIRAERLGLVDVAAVVQKPTSSSTTAFSIIRTENVAQLSAAAILTESNTSEFSVNAELEGRVRALTINAVLLSPAQANYPIEAWIGSVGLDHDIDAITSIAGLDVLSTTAMLAFDGTAVFLDSRDTSSILGFAGGVEPDQAITMVPGVQAQAELSDIDVTSTTVHLDTTTTTTGIDVTETTSDFIDFDGGAEEVTDG
jgi:hypothetical protein